ncbi:SusC/RagA family TonB-linked outer membrane protein [Marinifilum flexuosum]|uniref:TonB-linked SusC/RagA family outer membrane protein n=1 Tax=Marinifilum flexuosum TaxID=1117708 RepID=A0A419WT40_9BACT|nr:SusC/RagA family TonB-linked outer membrane protein [Marinifilum flexuosum]RKD98568.1 TonB-linked SusC/RagA family outer membrane protein [Marinifilum flexuosum]
MRRMLTLLLILLPAFVWAQEMKLIKGKVLSESDGDVLIGASVYIDKATIGAETGMKGIIENISLGTITDFDGNFSLEVPKQLNTISCSFLGFETQVVDIKGKSFVTIKLGESTSELGEVIVTGYQKIEKRKVTSAVVKVNADNIQQAGVVSVDHMLSGQLAGVTAVTQNGAPGAPAKIRIRGTVSLSGSQDPLWVVDGMPLEGNDVPDFSDKDNIDQLYNSSIAGFNPSDIADITILKDAAATAIYGARAANGVIVVTTKNGKQGSMRVSFSSNTTFTQRPDLSQLNLLNSNQKVDLELGLAARTDYSYRNGNGGVARILDQYNDRQNYLDNGFSGISNNAQADINALRAINTNWEDLLYQTAVNQDQSLSVSGGNEFATYYFSAGYHGEKGTTIGTSLDRINLTSKIRLKLNEKMNFGAAVFLSQRKTKGYLTGSDLFTNPAYYSRTVNPYQKVFNADGSYAYDRETTGALGTPLDFNIIEERRNTSNELTSRNINAIFDFDYKISKGVKYSTQLGIQTEDRRTEQIATKDSYIGRRTKHNSRYTGKNDKGEDVTLYDINEGFIKVWDADFFQYNLKNIIEVNKSINEDHEFDLMLGNEIRANETTTIYSANYAFDRSSNSSVAIDFHNADAAKRFKGFNKSFVKNTFASFFSTLSYSYKHKYTLFGSIRYDGSNLFGVDKKYKYQPLWALSGSWNATEEEFLKNVTWLNSLKFRASYGLQGNVDKSTSTNLIGNKARVEILPGMVEEVLRVDNPQNPYLRWEKTRTYNAGFDVAIFKNAIRASVDFYHRKSTDLINLRALPLENGFNFAPINWAAVTNKGFEIGISTRNIYNKDFEWTTNFNISRNIDKVDNIQVRNDSWFPSGVGRPVNALYVLKTDGLDENGMPVFVKDGKKMNLQEFAGIELKWGFWPTPTLSPKEFRELFTYAGSADPKFSGGIINTFKYKNFDLSIACNFNLGQKVRITPPYNMTEYDRALNTTTDILNAWTPENTNTHLPRLIGASTADGAVSVEHQLYSNNDPINYLKYLDIWIKEMNYLRCTNIRLGYSFPKHILEKVNLSSARLSVEARNPFVISNNYDGYFDPETFGNIYAQPIAKSYSIGINVGF